MARPMLNHNNSPKMEELKRQASDFYDNHCTYLPGMLGWFVFSVLLTAYNKYVFGEDHYDFKCPLLMTSIHFLSQWMFSELLCAIWPDYWGADRQDAMNWNEYLSLAVPCGLVTSGDVGLSNLSFKRLSISFYTMVKASSPVFVLAWAYYFGIERITLGLVGVVVVIIVGECLAVLGEIHFDVKGFCYCLTATFLSGARWTLVQLKLHNLQPPLKTTIATMRLLAPCMFFSLFAASTFIERPWNKFAGMDMAQATVILLLGLLGAFFAICMLLFEFSLIMNANALILMIGGVLKEMISIAVGVKFYGDVLNSINIAGCFVVFLGVVLYKLIFHLNKDHRDHALSHLSDRGTPTRYSQLQRHDDGGGGVDDDNSVEWEQSITETSLELRERASSSPKSARQTLQSSTTAAATSLPEFS